MKKIYEWYIYKEKEKKQLRVILFIRFRNPHVSIHITLTSLTLKPSRFFRSPYIRNIGLRPYLEKLKIRVETRHIINSDFSFGVDSSQIEPIWGRRQHPAIRIKKFTTWQTVVVPSAQQREPCDLISSKIPRLNSTYRPSAGYYVRKRIGVKWNKE